MGKLRIILVSATIITLVGVCYVRFYLLPKIDRDMNPVLAHEPYPVSDEAQELHNSISVSDLHADTLLWQRNPAKRNARGHTDLPRLREGGVVVQVFTTVTKSPSGLNYNENTADSDDITRLAIAQAWPPRTWNSIFERARFQAQRLHKLDRNDPDFHLILTRSDLENALSQRQSNKGILAGILGMEGAHPLEGNLENTNKLYEEGFRIIGLQHFFDNELGGSLHGISGDGLTDFGRQVIARAEERKMIIDVAHSAPAVIRETLSLTKRPVIVSHTGFSGHCPSARNISDDLMKQITDRGGLIGVGFWADVTCDDSPNGIAKAIGYGIDNFGADHIALGSDFDGTVTTRLDASELRAITQALLENGIDKDTIRKIMGENAVRFFLENLPE